MIQSLSRFCELGPNADLFLNHLEGMQTDCGLRGCYYIADGIVYQTGVSLRFFQKLEAVKVVDNSF